MYIDIENGTNTASDPRYRILLNAGKADKADKLTTARKISLTGDVTGEVNFDGSTNVSIATTVGDNSHNHGASTITSVYDTALTWSPNHLKGSISLIDFAASPLHAQNKFAFANPAGITVEYSTNGGSTWSTYSVSNENKIALVTTGLGTTLTVGAKSSNITVNDQLRITLDATAMGLYTSCKKLLINLTTNGAGGTKCKVEKSMKGSTTTFTTMGTYDVTGWSGWNSIPIGQSFGGGSTQTSNIAKLRLTFTLSSLNTNYSNALTVLEIIGLGETNWTNPSNMSRQGHLYSYDTAQNATFPANITATTFIGALSGNASTATKLLTPRTISLTGDVSGSGTFDGSSDLSITATVADNSHNHNASNITAGTLETARGGTGNNSFTANRMLYTESATKFATTNHYVSTSKVAINSTSAPTAALHINGDANVTNSLFLNSAVKFTYNSTDKCIDVIFV